MIAVDDGLCIFDRLDLQKQEKGFKMPIFLLFC